MHDDDIEGLWAEKHDFQPGDRVLVVEGNAVHKLGLRAGVVTAIDRSLAVHLLYQSLRLDIPVDAIMPLPPGKDNLWRSQQYWPIVAFDQFEPGSDAANEPIGTEWAMLPVDLVKVE